MKQTVSGVILCGGRSSRMGRPKALLPWHGQALIAHMVSSLSEFLEDIVVVSNAGLQLPSLEARVVVDRTADLGPLAGIREALHAIHHETAFITSTDAPYVDGSLIRALSASGQTAAFEVDGWVEPFPAVYARHLCGVADALLAQGRRRPLHLLQEGGFQRLDGSEWAAKGFFDNFNTPQQYLRAVRATEKQATATVVLTGAAAATMGQTHVRTAVGTLEAVLRALEPRLQLVTGDGIAPGIRVTLADKPVENLGLPVGPGEHLLVFDADSIEPIQKGELT